MALPVTRGVLFPLRLHSRIAVKAEPNQIVGGTDIERCVRPVPRHEGTGKKPVLPLDEDVAGLQPRAKLSQFARLNHELSITRLAKAGASQPGRDKRLPAISRVLGHARRLL